MLESVRDILAKLPTQPTWSNTCLASLEYLAHIGKQIGDDLSKLLYIPYNLQVAIAFCEKFSWNNPRNAKSMYLQIT